MTRIHVFKEPTTPVGKLAALLSESRVSPEADESGAAPMAVFVTNLGTPLSDNIATFVVAAVRSGIAGRWAATGVPVAP